MQQQKVRMCECARSGIAAATYANKCMKLAAAMPRRSLAAAMPLRVRVRVLVPRAMLAFQIFAATSHGHHIELF